jgi:hypothetical protein
MMKVQVFTGVLLAVLAAGKYECRQVLGLLHAFSAELTALMVQLADLFFQH